LEKYNPNFLDIALDLGVASVETKGRTIAEMVLTIGGKQ